MISAPSASWIATARSGLRKWAAPSMCERNETPRGDISRSVARLKTW